MSSPTEIEIRAAALEDVPAVLELIAPFVKQRKLLPRTEEEMRKLITHGFAAIRAGKLVGFAALEVYSLKMAEVQCLAVCPEAQGNGVGRRLIRQCVARAEELNVLEVMAITSSEKPFADCGFDFSLPDQKKAMFVRTRDPH